MSSRGGVVSALACAAVLLCALVLPAGAAHAAGTSPTVPPASNPFAPGIPTPQATTPTVQTTPTIQTTPATTTAGSGGAFSGSGIAAIAVGALVILGGISFYIWYDARRRAPVRARAVADGAGLPGSGKTGSKARPKPRKLSPAERRRRKRGRAR